MPKKNKRKRNTSQQHGHETTPKAFQSSGEAISLPGTPSTFQASADPAPAANSLPVSSDRALPSLPTAVQLESSAAPPLASLTRSLASIKVKESRVGGYGFSPSDRDLSALLAYGPSFIPYVAAWTDSRIEQVRHYKHWIFVAVNKIATTLARQFPNISYVRTESKPGNRKAWLKVYQRQKALLPLRTHEHLEPVPDNHPLVRLLKDPNEPDTSYDVWYETILFYLLTGSAYWWMPTNNIGLPAAIWVVPSHWMWPIVGKDRMISGWEIRPVEGNYLRKLLPAEEVIHFRSKNPISKIDGFSPLTAGSQWGDIQERIDRSQWQSYANAPMSNVAIQFDGTMHDPSDELLRRIEQRFYARYSGDVRAGKPLFLPPGVKAVPLSIQPNMMAFGETGDKTRDKILALFGVPASVAMIDVPTSLRARTAAQVAFYSDTIANHCTYLGQVMTEKLAWRYDHNLRVWYEDRTPQDPQLLEQQIKTDLLSAAITPNEVRTIRGREAWPEDWADKPIIPVNMTPGSLPGGGMHATDNKLPDDGTPDYEHPALNDDDYKSILSLLQSRSINGKVTQIPLPSTASK